MKKLIAVILLAVSVFGLASCGIINRKSEVSVLWSDMSETYYANLSDALDRAMYTQNINYAHYDADGKAATQLQQAKDAIKNGAAAIVINAVDRETASSVLTLAKNSSTPIIFLATDASAIPEECTSYDKCYIVDLDAAGFAKVMGEMVAEDVFANFKNYDRNEDGVITAAAVRYSELAIDYANAKLLELYDGLSDKKKEKQFPLGVPEIQLDIYKHFCLDSRYMDVFIDALFIGTNKDPEKAEYPVEILLTDDESYVVDAVLALQRYGFNSTNLVTHFLPTYTVGYFENASVLKYGTVEDDAELNHKKESTREDKQKTRDAYSVASAIDSGYITSAVIVDDDAMANAVAVILRNLIKGKDVFNKIDENYINGKNILVPYTVY